MTPAKSPLPFLGTWKTIKVEPARPELPHPTSGTMTIAQEQDGLHLTGESVWSDGRTVKINSVYQPDGKWYPVTGSPIADSISARSIDDSSMEAKLRKGGTDVGTNRVTVSADGRTLTSEADMTGPDGAALKWKTTSQRQ